jgi:TPR repeat protein
LLDRLYDAFSAYTRGDYETSMRLFRPLAEEGDTDAQANLGFMYQNGQGIPQDDKQAVAWYRKAADQGSAYGQTNLGFMYESGRGARRRFRPASRPAPFIVREREPVTRSTIAAKN